MWVSPGPPASEDREDGEMTPGGQANETVFFLNMEKGINIERNLQKMSKKKDKYPLYSLTGLILFSQNIS